MTGRTLALSFRSGEFHPFETLSKNFWSFRRRNFYLYYIYKVVYLYNEVEMLDFWLKRKDFTSIAVINTGSFGVYLRKLAPYLGEGKPSTRLVISFCRALALLLVI